VSIEIAIAVIAAVPPTLAAILGFLANRRSLRRSIGGNPGVPLASVMQRTETKIDRIDAKVDRLAEGQAQVRERLARLEGESGRGLWSR
jgi:hypothetical protein